VTHFAPACKRFQRFSLRPLGLVIATRLRLALYASLYRFHNAIRASQGRLCDDWYFFSFSALLVSELQIT
jgi:hypothetical protein